MSNKIKMVVGLGNPGKEYEQTRHNAGFWFLDELAWKWKASFKEEKNSSAKSPVPPCPTAMSGCSSRPRS